MNDIMNYLHKITPELILIGSLTIIQVVPIKINPWTCIAGWIKRAIGIGALDEKMISLDKKIDNLEIKFDEQIKHLDADSAETRARVIRKEIITFAEDSKRGCDFSFAEFEQISLLIDEYRKLIVDYGIKNSFGVAQMDYIENEMQKRREKTNELE